MPARNAFSIADAGGESVFPKLTPLDLPLSGEEGPVPLDKGDLGGLFLLFSQYYETINTVDTALIGKSALYPYSVV